MSTWPRQDYASLVKFFGKVGENQARLALPYPMRLTWEPDGPVLKSITCHEKVAASLGSILKKTADEYGPKRIHALGLDRFSGCLNVRKMRGGSSWSMHSWGIAMDLDDERNQLRWNKTRAVFARPEYLPFWDIVAGQGWTALGPARDFDWMHFQAAGL